MVSIKRQCGLFFSPFIKVSESDILNRGTAQGHRYIVYYTDDGIYVNTDFKETDKGVYKCCLYYGRKLCDTLNEYKIIAKEEIERQAYNAWMDGAH